jgi:hypothetical protein
MEEGDVPERVQQLLRVSTVLQLLRREHRVRTPMQRRAPTQPVAREVEHSAPKVNWNVAPAAVCAKRSEPLGCACGRSTGLYPEAAFFAWRFERRARARRSAIARISSSEHQGFA